MITLFAVMLSWRYFLFTHCFFFVLCFSYYGDPFAIAEKIYIYFCFSDSLRYTGFLFLFFPGLSSFFPALSFAGVVSGCFWKPSKKNSVVFWSRLLSLSGSVSRALDLFFPKFLGFKPRYGKFFCQTQCGLQVFLFWLFSFFSVFSLALRHLAFLCLELPLGLVPSSV